MLSSVMGKSDVQFAGRVVVDVVGLSGGLAVTALYDEFMWPVKPWETFTASKGALASLKRTASSFSGNSPLKKSREARHHVAKGEGRCPGEVAVECEEERKDWARIFRRKTQVAVVGEA